MQELECSHEEADMRMLLHAQHAAESGHGAQSLFALPALMWLSLPVDLQVRYISPINFADRHSPEDAVPGFVSDQSTSSQ